MNITSMETYVDEKFIFHRVKFFLILVLQILAIIISLVIFVFFMKHRAVLYATRNHVLSIILVVNFIQLVFDMPLVLNFYFRGYVNPATPTFCTWWTFFEFTLYATSEYLVLTMSIQRHMLIFNGHILQIRWKRIVFHKLPVLICLIYPVTFYIFAIILYPCDGSPWDYTNNICGFTGCYLAYDKILGTYDWVANNGLPMFTDVWVNILLIVRVMRQKRRHQAMSWRQQRQMMIQLLCVSSLYLIGWAPSLIAGVGQIFFSPSFLAEYQSNYFLDMIYIICLFLPWMVLGLLPEMRRWIKELYRGRLPRNVVGTIPLRHVETIP